MGICKCRKRTDLFCFVHKKAVCETCICSDHQVCVVKSYFDWLSEPEYETPVCGVCKGELNPENLVRFLCLDMFHPECVDMYAASLPATTAQAGYTCPTCDKPMLPPPNNTTALAQQIRKSFANSTWANRVLGSEPNTSADMTSKDKPPFEEKLASSNETIPNNIPAVTLTDPSPPFTLPTATLSEKPPTADTAPNGLHPLDPLSYHPPPTTIFPPNTTININQPPIASSYGMASHRKTQKANTSSSQVLDEDEDKYRRKGFMQLFAALGLVSTPTISESKRGLRVDPKRVLVFFATMTTVVIFIFLYFEMFKPDPIITVIAQ